MNKAVQNVRQEPPQKAQRYQAQSEEAQVPPVHPTRPEGRKISTSTNGLRLRTAPSTTATLPAAADPQPAETSAALIFPSAPVSTEPELQLPALKPAHTKQVSPVTVLKSFLTFLD